MRWDKPIILALKRLRPQDCEEVETNLGCRASFRTARAIVWDQKIMLLTNMHYVKFPRRSLWTKIDLLKIICDGVRVCATNAHVHTHACGGQRTILSSFSRCCPPYILKQGLSKAWSSPSRPGWLANRPRRSSCLCLSSPGTKSTHHHSQSYSTHSGD